MSEVRASFGTAKSEGQGMTSSLELEPVDRLALAAGIWVAGAIGLAIGSGMYFYGLVCAAITALMLLSERFLRPGERLGRALTDRATTERHGWDHAAGSKVDANPERLQALRESAYGIR